MVYGSYTKKPIPISAVSFEGQSPMPGDYNRCPQWFQDALRDNVIWFEPLKNVWKVNSLEGIMEGDLNCYIVQGNRKEIYICDGEIWKETYNVVKENRQ